MEFEIPQVLARAEADELSQDHNDPRLHFRQVLCNLSFTLPVADPAACQAALAQLCTYVKDCAADRRNNNEWHAHLCRAMVLRVVNTTDPYDRLGAWYVIDMLLRETKREDKLPRELRVLGPVAGLLMRTEKQHDVLLGLDDADGDKNNNNNSNGVGVGGDNKDENGEGGDSNNNPDAAIKRKTALQTLSQTCDLTRLILCRWMEYDENTAQEIRDAYRHLRHTMLGLVSPSFGALLAANFRLVQQRGVGAVHEKLTLRENHPGDELDKACVWLMRVRQPRPSACVLLRRVFAPEHRRQAAEKARRDAAADEAKQRIRAQEQLQRADGAVPLYTDGGIVPSGMAAAAAAGHQHHQQPQFDLVDEQHGGKHLHIKHTAALAALMAHSNVTNVHLQAVGNSNDEEDDEPEPMRPDQPPRAGGPAVLNIANLKAHERQVGTAKIVGGAAAAAAAAAAAPVVSPYQPDKKRNVDRIRKWINSVDDKYVSASHKFCLMCDTWEHGKDACPCTVIHGGHRAPQLSRERARALLIAAGAPPHAVGMIGQIPDADVAAAAAPARPGGVGSALEAAARAENNPAVLPERSQHEQFVAATHAVLDAIAQAIVRKVPQWPELVDAFDVLRYRHSDVRERRALFLLASYNMTASRVLVDDEQAMAGGAAGAMPDGDPAAAAELRSMQERSAADLAARGAAGGDTSVNGQFVMTGSLRRAVALLKLTGRIDEARRVKFACDVLQHAYAPTWTPQIGIDNIKRALRAVRRSRSYFFCLFGVLPTLPVALAPDGLPLSESAGVAQSHNVLSAHARASNFRNSMPCAMPLPCNLRSANNPMMADLADAARPVLAPHIQDCLRYPEPVDVDVLWQLVHHVDRASLRLLPLNSASVPLPDEAGYTARILDEEPDECCRHHRQKVANVGENAAKFGGLGPKDREAVLAQMEPHDYAVARFYLERHGIAPPTNCNTGFRPEHVKADIRSRVAAAAAHMPREELRRLEIAVWLLVERDVPYCRFCASYGHGEDRCARRHCITLKRNRIDINYIDLQAPVVRALLERLWERAGGRQNFFEWREYKAANGGGLVVSSSSAARGNGSRAPRGTMPDAEQEMLGLRAVDVEQAYAFLRNRARALTQEQVTALVNIGTTHYGHFCPVTVTMARYFPATARRAAAASDAEYLGKDIDIVAAPEFPDVCLFCSSFSHKAAECGVPFTLAEMDVIQGSNSSARLGAQHGLLPLPPQEAAQQRSPKTWPLVHAVLQHLERAHISLRDFCAALAQHRTRPVALHAQMRQLHDQEDALRGPGFQRALAELLQLDRTVAGAVQQQQAVGGAGTAADVCFSFAALKRLLLHRFVDFVYVPPEEEPERLDELARSAPLSRDMYADMQAEERAMLLSTTTAAADGAAASSGSTQQDLRMYFADANDDELDCMRRGGGNSNSVVVSALRAWEERRPAERSDILRRTRRLLLRWQTTRDRLVRFDRTWFAQHGVFASDRDLDVQRRRALSIEECVHLRYAALLARAMPVTRAERDAVALASGIAVADTRPSTQQEREAETLPHTLVAMERSVELDLFQARQKTAAKVHDFVAERRMISNLRAQRQSERLSRDAGRASAAAGAVAGIAHTRVASGSASSGPLRRSREEDSDQEAEEAEAQKQQQTRLPVSEDELNDMLSDLIQGGN